jgi:hypothetical protein
MKLGPVKMVLFSRPNIIRKEVGSVSGMITDRGETCPRTTLATTNTTQAVLVLEDGAP